MKTKREKITNEVIFHSTISSISDDSNFLDSRLENGFNSLMNNEAKDGHILLKGQNESEAEIAKKKDLIEKVLKKPELIGVLSYNEFEWQMQNLKDAMDRVKFDKTIGKYYSKQLKYGDMYFRLMSFIFGCDQNFVEGFNIIESWVFFYDFGKKFVKGDIINKNLSPNHPYYAPDLSTTRKFWEYLCLIKLSTINATNEELNRIKDNIYIHIPSQIESENRDKLELKKLREVSKNRKCNNEFV